MKLFQKNIVKNFSIAIFVFALLLPTTVQFAHAFEGHEHKPCIELSTHLHQKQLDCSICDFHYSIFTFTLIEVPEFDILPGFESAPTVYLFQASELNSTHYFLRGPPLFS